MMEGIVKGGIETEEDSVAKELLLPRRKATQFSVLVFPLSLVLVERLQEDVAIAYQRSLSGSRAQDFLTQVCPFQQATLVILVGLLTVCLWYFAYISPRLAVTQHNESLRKEILASTVEFLDELFQWNAYGARSLVGMLEKDLLGDGASLESFIKIRAASWSLFKAIPQITSIGVTSLSGLTGLYDRGGLYPGDSETGTDEPMFVYRKSTDEYSPYYIESVNASTGEALEDPKEYYFKEHIENRKWFQSALSIPRGQTAWHLERSQMSGRPYIQSGIPVFCETSKQMAVVHCSHSAKAITEYLSTTMDLKGGNVLVANDLGEVLLSSEENCWSSNTHECKGHSEVRDAMTFIETQTQLKELVKKEIHYADVQIGGRRYFIDSWHQSFQGMKLVVVIVIPRQSIWQAMDSHTCSTLVAIAVLALGLSLAGGALGYLLMDGIAEEVKLRAELLRQLEAKRRAEASRDAKTAFLSHMSHELRTPMACIIGLLEILMGDLKLSEHEGSVKQVHRCATSLVTLLNSALDIAKVEAGKLELEKADFDLETELSSLIDVFSVQCDAKGLHLSLQLSDDIPKLVNGDPARVMQIFTNLLGNGIKFTKAGRIVVRGWVDEADSPNETGKICNKDQVVMMFEVDDTGPGIDTALRERVFENFVQGDASTPRTHGGTGLGLGIVRSLVHLMGGAIRIVDKSGKGTLFQFTLCFDLPSEQPARESEVVKSRQIVLGMPEKDCRDVVAQWLEDRGLSVHQAGSWEDVLIHLKALPLPLYGRKRIEENQGKPITLEEDSKYTQRRRFSSDARFGRPSGGWVIRRSKSDGTSDSKGEKPVLIVDVNLLPHFLDETEYLHAFEKLGFSLKIGSPQAHYKFLDFHALVWVTASNTPASFKRALKLLSRSILVRGPLHPSRLSDLFHQLEARQQFGPMEGMAVNVAPSQLSVKIAKQVSDLHTGDEAPGYVEDFVERSSPHSSEPRMGTIHEGSNGGSRSNLEVLSNKTTNTDTPPASQQFPPTSLARSKSDNVSKLVKVLRPKPVPKALEQLEILVAEDHPLLRRLATTMLRKLGAAPDEAANGQEAFNSVVTRFERGLLPFHCILMDCQMPIMDGYDACRAIRDFEDEKEQHTRIIALTANAMATDEQKCFSVGMDAFLSKPIQQEHLIRVILSTMGPASQDSGPPLRNQLES